MYFFSMDSLAILSSCVFFRSLSAAGQNALAAMCIIRQIEKGKVLFCEGEKGMAVYICIHGNIKLYKRSDRGKEIVIKVIMPGEFFAEAVLFEQDYYPVTAVALTRCTLAMIPRHQFLCLLSAPDLQREIVGGILQKMRFLTDRIRQLSGSDVRRRLTAFLRDLYGPQRSITCCLSKKEVAAAIGVTPESLSRVLRQLSNEKLLHWKRNKLDIADGFWT